MVCLIILIAFYLVGIFGPVIAGMYGISPYTLDANAISDFAGKPYGAFGGISAAHPLGVEWGTGRDIFAQLLFGLRISLIISTTATLLTVTIGVLIGIIAGYAGGITDSLLGRLMDILRDEGEVGASQPVALSPADRIAALLGNRRAGGV